MAGERPFAQTFIGAILVAVIGGLMVIIIDRSYLGPKLQSAGHNDVARPEQGVLGQRQLPGDSRPEPQLTRPQREPSVATQRIAPEEKHQATENPSDWDRAD